MKTITLNRARYVVRDAVLEYLGEKTQVIGVTDAGAVVYNSEF